nr:hypothetical protein [Arthrobacter sp. SF27]
MQLSAGLVDVEDDLQPVPRSVRELSSAFSSMRLAQAGSGSVARRRRFVSCVRRWRTSMSMLLPNATRWK